MDYRQLLLSQANALAAAGCYGGGYSSASSSAAAAAYSQSAAARTYSYRLWTLANVLTDPCRRFEKKKNNPCLVFLSCLLFWLG
jgi:hypothetical protein